METKATFGSPLNASEVQLGYQPHWQPVWLSISVQPKSIFTTLISQKPTGAESNSRFTGAAEPNSADNEEEIPLPNSLKYL
ncbi:hypothetical protein GOBAR_AA24013 [Gossypium barbadense]|uniref:Uncharacterized protein n=1 Tax=Gossypium barbadense TaxID=3634 RepID=A0A2P5WZX8_GOSBA|nr:hypothetical protein GOBAR_AA24013 [Gossypium barbadense]